MTSPFFIALGHHGQRLISRNGRDWEQQALGLEGDVYRTAAFGNGRLVVIGTYGGGNCLTSTRDGVTWEPRVYKDGKYSRFVRNVCFGKDHFVGTGGDPSFSIISADGVEWSDYLPAPWKKEEFMLLRRIAYGNDRFAAVGDHGRRATSKDGRVWTDAEGVKAVDTLVDIAFGKDRFVGVGLHGLRMTSADGLQWGDRQVGKEGEHLNSILWTGERFVAVGMGATYFSPDGTEWERRPNKNAPLAAAYGNGVFVGSHWKGRLLYSEDAVEWRQVLKSEHHVEVVTWAG